MSKGTPGVRYAEVERETRATRVQVVLDLDGGSRRDISTGIHFFDHMLAEMAFHGQLDLGIVAEGDLEVDDHHTAIDVGIVLGDAIAMAIESDDSIVRFGNSTVACEDALVLVAVDLAGHGSLHSDLAFERDRLGGLSSQSVNEYFRSLAINAQMTIHIQKLAGRNDHNVCEAAFKAFGLAVRDAVVRTERRGSSASKGTRD
ncbi:MAG TPA: imidazoleglycerol-phosphate dehydratase [Fimbriimonadaceae bacterium]|nr:imidazoleglycerol-phosphate dehydratase [Fimbriimonadaceae bacterium]